MGHVTINFKETAIMPDEHSLESCIFCKIINQEIPSNLSWKLVLPQELDEELEKDKNDESKPKKPLHSAMVEQLSSLQKDLSRLSQNIGEPDSIDEKEGTIIKQAELSKKLINQLQSFKHSGVPKENGISKDKDTPTATETNGHDLDNATTKNVGIFFI
ncbi:4343_t:CDS:2 [Entrophospora sp. SA101]|nr:4343_t:CDS:2 [Entrophospora sp. SA101]